jgi:RNA polymerase sigma factor (sigma-70 family)
VRSEEELVRACARGDAEAWRRLVDLYSGWVLGIARSSLRRLGGTGAASDAEDACADVFRQLVDRDRALLRSLQPPYNLRAWLAVVTRRTCGKLMRRRPGATADPAQIAAPEASRFEEHLSQLPPQDRLLLELFFVHDASYEEIADVLGISPESVGKQKTRALEKLRKSMDEGPK